jgi:adenylyltransferase/sulfurtransferase
MTAAALEIPSALRERIYAHARRCFPAECCGYLRGSATVDQIVECRNAHEDGEHPTAPERTDDSAFVIAGAELFAFAKSFESASPARVVYHSHTNGRAYFSKVDRDVATVHADSPAGCRALPSYPVQHLVVGVTATSIIEAAQFAWSAEQQDWIEVARWQIDRGDAP